MNSKVYPVSSCELDCVNIDGLLFLSAPVSPEKKRTAKPCVKCVYSDYANYQTWSRNSQFLIYKIISLSC